MQVTGFDIPHQFPIDYYPVFGMDVRSCIDYYRQRVSK
jgi:dual specificity phosphatase 12